MAKPTIVLAHGSWHSPSHYSKLLTYMESHNYTCIAPHLPSTHPGPGKTYPHAGQTDTTLLRSVLEETLSSGQDIVLVLHSSSGVCGSSACAGLGATTRTAAGHPTAVLAIAYIAAFILPVGTSIASGQPAPEHDVRGDMLYVAASPGAIHWFYHDVDAGEARRAAAALLPKAWRADDEECTFAAYQVIPCSYLVCEWDRAVPAFVQRGFVDRARENGGLVSAEVCEAGHSPFLSMASQTGDWVRRVAGEGIETGFVAY